MFLFTPLYLDRVDYVKAKCYHYHYYLFFFHLQAESLQRKHCLENGMIYTAHITKIQVDLINDSLIRISYCLWSPLNNQSQKGLRHCTSQAKDVFHIRLRICADRFLLIHAGITVASIPRSYLTPNMKTFNGGVSQTFCKPVK